MFFDEIKTINDLKTAYRKLALKNHPDRGGDEKTMAAINAEYEEVFKKLNTVSESGEAKYKMDDGFREVIDKIINLEGLEIEICGQWIWVSGNTRENKEALKASGFYWAKKKKMWYWRPEDAKVRSTSGIKDMDYIRNAYGSQKIKEGYKSTRKAISA